MSGWDAKVRAVNRALRETTERDSQHRRKDPTTSVPLVSSGIYAG